MIERVVDATSAIGKGLVKKEDDVNMYVTVRIACFCFSD